MINLAPLKYSRLFQWPNDVIKNISHTEKEIRINQNGFETYITLQDNLLPVENKYQLYGNHHGTGSDQYLNIAIYKGISEALERWAFIDSLKNMPQNFGYSINTSTDGMAAFPGLFKFQTRRLAYYEAIERWALKYWWCNLLPVKNCKTGQNLNFSVIEICTPFKNTSTVILWMRILPYELVTYAFATSNNLSNAIYKAQIELLRNVSIVKKHLSFSEESKQKINSVTEKRLLFFATTMGKKKFDEKIYLSQDISLKKIILPKVVFDGEIRGTWTKYAIVWRTLFDSPTLSSTDEEIFFF